MSTENRRILAVDPGGKRIGIAVSDPTGTIANPLTVIKHTSRGEDAARVAEIAGQQGAVRIIVGHPLDADGEAGPAALRAERFAEALREQTDLPVEMWDEFGSTREARQARIAMGVSRRKRRGHLDDLAAAVILQNYLDFIAAHSLPLSGEGS
jgi:putative Holliday junction resolvase